MRYCPACDFEGDAESCPKDGTPTAPMPAARPATPPPIGLVLEGRYRLDAVVGHGGMGWVLKANNLRTGHDVAVKMMRRELAENVQAVRRFQREARISASLTHPNTVKVYDFGVSGDGHPFIVMEFLNGKALDDVVSTSGVPDPRLVCRWMVGICGALAEAHSAGLIHRDLKPANLFLVNVPGGDPFLKVVDFGIAKTDPNRTGESLLTQAGAIVGTPAYMSPEQIRGKELDARSDLYSLGMILYELLSGAPPCKADSVMELMAWHLTQPAPDLDENGPYGGLPASLRTLVKSLLGRSVDERPATASDVAERLSAIAREFEGERGPSRAVAASSKLPAPTPTDATVDAPIAQLTPWKPDAVVLPVPPTAPSSETSDRGPARGRRPKAAIAVAVVVALAAAVTVWMWPPRAPAESGVPVPSRLPDPSPSAPAPAVVGETVKAVAVEPTRPVSAEAPQREAEPTEPAIATAVSPPAPAPTIGSAVGADATSSAEADAAVAPAALPPAVVKPSSERSASAGRPRVAPSKAPSRDATPSKVDPVVAPKPNPSPAAAAPEPVLFD